MLCVFVVVRLLLFDIADCLLLVSFVACILLGCVRGCVCCCWFVVALLCCLLICLAAGLVVYCLLFAI